MLVILYTNQESLACHPASNIYVWIETKETVELNRNEYVEKYETRNDGTFYNKLKRYYFFHLHI